MLAAMHWTETWWEWEARLDDSKVSDEAKHDARELSYAVYEYDRAAKS